MFDAQLRRVGEIGLTELAAIGRLTGYDSLPYPFAHTRAEDRGAERLASVAERVDGDLGEFRKWIDAYVAAEIWVTCRVHHSRADVPDGRVLGFRGGDVGYVARQRGSDDVVEVFVVHADDLGAASASMIGLSQPGTHSRIVVPDYVGYFTQPTESGEADGEDHAVQSVLTTVNRPRRQEQEVIADDVAAIAIIQPRRQPAREWGVDWTEPLIACVRVSDDGDYIYTPDFAHAVPLTDQSLSDAINRLIAVMWSY